MDAHAPPRRQWWRGLVKGVLIGAGFIGAVELAARVLDLQAGFLFITARQTCMQRDEVLGIAFAPNCEGVIHAKAANTRFHTNSLGLRDPELDTDSATRILALGDSCTWGWGLEEGTSYPRVLQRLLNERFGAGRYRVINSGMPGTTAYQGVRWLRARGLALAPEIVIFGYGFNDQWRAGRIEEWMHAESRNLWLADADHWLIDHSRMWRWLRWQTRPTSNSGKLPARSSPERFEREMRDLVELTRASGARPLMLKLYPLRPRYTRAITDVSTDMRVPLVEYTGPRIDFVHPTRDGARDLAAQILDQLVDSGYVGSSDGSGT